MPHETPTPAAQAFDLAVVISRQQQKLEKSQQLNDRFLDMYSDLMEWVVNTDHEECSDQVQSILEKHYQAAKQSPSSESISL